MDNLLPLYAKIIDNVCPCNTDDFAVAFNSAFNAARSIPQTKKTLDNHRTEIAGQLFGMHYTSDEGTVYPSERTFKFLADSDTPSFFKDICYKMQFPNGSQVKDLKSHIENGICLRQFPFLLKVMQLANSNNIILTKKEIGYYILNSLDVLQGKATPLEVFDAIASDRASWGEAVRDPGSGSYTMQHIIEQINLLELANLVIVKNDEVFLNPLESKAIQIFSEKYADKPAFDVYSYDLSLKDQRKRFRYDWSYYNSTLSDRAGDFDTTTEALGVPAASETIEETDDSGRDNTIEIGDEGERYVFNYEKRRVTEFNFRLAGKVIHLGKTRGLGYDIQSVVAKAGETAEFVKYIEVKATKRVTVPDINDTTWIDTFNMTRNEWVASQQHRGYYSIFRVYFVRDSVIMYVLNDIASKHDSGVVQAVPTTYRLDFRNNAVDEVINHEGGTNTNA